MKILQRFGVELLAFKSNEKDGLSIREVIEEIILQTPEYEDEMIKMSRSGVLIEDEVENLRQKYRPNQRTIQRDLNQLQSVGFVFYDHEVRRWFLSGQNNIPIPIANDESLAALVLRSNLSVFEDGIFKTEFAKIDQKLHETYFNKTNIKFGKIFENIDFGNYNYPKSDLIKSLLNSILENIICTVKYQALGKNKPKKYEILPMKMFLYDGGLYIIAYHTEHESFFPLGVHRIIDVKKENSWRIRFRNKQLPTFSFSEYRKNSFGVFVTGKTEKVKLKFLPDAAHYINRRFWHSSQKITLQKNGNLILEMEVGVTWELVSWIMRWMPNVIVMRPKSLKKQVKERLQQSLSKFS